MEDENDIRIVPESNVKVSIPGVGDVEIPDDAIRRGGLLEALECAFLAAEPAREDDSSGND